MVGNTTAMNMQHGVHTVEVGILLAIVAAVAHDLSQFDGRHRLALGSWITWPEMDLSSLDVAESLPTERRNG